MMEETPQYRKDQDERRGYRQGYRDSQLGIHDDPVYASPDFRRGYLAGHYNGERDRRMGMRLDISFY